MSSPDNIHDVLQRLGREMEVFKKEDLRQQLRTYINHLILHDFDRLVQILYQVDVEEKKLKELLAAEPGKDAATLITDLIIQRQEQKRTALENHPAPDSGDEEERW
jgi:predicted acylesterase/phospholipase RssA